MISSKPPSPNAKSSPTLPRRKRPPSPGYSAQEKVQAVLTVWTERRKPVEVCRQMRINWTTFRQWQQRAMEGMLQALETRTNLVQGGALSPRLVELLQQQSRSASTQRLTQRLAQLPPPPLPQPKVANPPAAGP